MKSSPRSLSGFLIPLTILVLVSARQGNAQFEQLVAKVPAAANAIVLIDVEKVMSSPVAVKEDWRSKQGKSYEAGLTFLPPHSIAAVLSSHLDLDQMVPAWSVAAIALDHEASLETVERMTGGKTDQIGKYPAVDLEGSGYLVKFAPQLVAAMAPASRQAVARWVQEVDSSSAPRLSPYLQEAYGFVSQIGTPLVLALDLQNAAAPDVIREALLDSEQYAKADPRRIDELVKLLASLRGITLGITLQRSEPFGKVKVDFGEAVSLAPEEAKAILIRALSKRGAMLDELEDWIPKVDGRMITMEGNLTASGIKRLSSLFDRPPAFPKEAPVAATKQDPPHQQRSSAQASQEFFHRIVDLIDDLEKKPQRSRGYTMGSIATWYESFARKIDQLPVVGVDPELSDFAAFTSDSLRSASTAIKSSFARKRVRQVNTSVPYDYNTYGTTYGYSARLSVFGAGYVPYGASATVAVPDYRAYQQARTAISAEERVTGANQSRDIMINLEKATGDMRRKMSMKYNISF